MFGRIVRKELAYFLLDLRFLSVFALVAGLSALSVYVGAQNYAVQMREYAATVESQRASLNSYIQAGDLFHLRFNGYRWTRRPETLSPVVYGLSGKMGREVHLDVERMPELEASLFEADPMYALFGVLDLAFVVKVVLSLCVLLFTYDAVCGEKEGGSLRLLSSFPVARSTLAAAKLVGATAAVLVPLVFAWLLAAVVMAVFPAVDLRVGDWLRMGVLAGTFGLYLVVFAAFGLWVSALTHRRMTAFLVLLGLWTVWIFVLPGLAVRTAGWVVPTVHPADLRMQADQLLWDMDAKRDAEVEAYWNRQSAGNWDALPEARKLELLAGERAVQERWDTEYFSRLRRLQESYRNAVRRRRTLAGVLASVSPLSAFSFLSMDVARTGIVQQERVEDALGVYLRSFAAYIRKKRAGMAERTDRGVDLGDFTPFAYRDRETLGACLARDAVSFLNLALLAVLGFAGAYTAMLRYDVR